MFIKTYICILASPKSKNGSSSNIDEILQEAYLRSSQ